MQFSIQKPNKNRRIEIALLSLPLSPQSHATRPITPPTALHPIHCHSLCNSLILKVALVNLFTICQEHIKLQESIGSGETFDPIWRIAQEPSELVRQLTTEIHQLVQGDASAFRDYLGMFRVNETAVSKLVALAKMPARRVFQIDAKTNERKRKPMEELIRLKTAVDGVASAA